MYHGHEGMSAIDIGCDEFVLSLDGDIDGDGASTLAEIAFGSDPVDPASYAELPASSKPALALLAALLLGVSCRACTTRARTRRNAS